MKIKLKQIKLENFLSHKFTKLDFPNFYHGIISGASGSGKSSIIDALVWCLYGRGRVDNRSLIRKGEKSATVSVILEGEKEIKVERSVNSKGKQDLVLFEKVGKEFKILEVSGTKNIQQYIEKTILNSSYLLFINSICYIQNNTESFVEQSASVRKDILMEIVSASSFDEYYNNAKKVISVLETELAVIANNIENINKEIDEGKDIAKDLLFYKKQKAELEEKINLVRAKKEKLQKELNIFEVNEKSIENLRTLNRDQKDKIDISRLKIKEIESRKKETESRSEIKEITESLLTLEKDKEELKIAKEVEKKANEWKSKMMELMSSKPPEIDYESNIKEINRQLVVLLTKTVAICPETQAFCGIIVAENDLKLKELQSMLETNESRFQEQNQAILAYNSNVDAIGVCPAVNSEIISTLELKIGRLEQEKLRLDELTKNQEIDKNKLEIHLEEENKKLIDLELSFNKSLEELSKTKDIGNKNSLVSSIAEISIDIETIENTKSVTNSQISILESNISKVEKQKEKLIELKKKKKELDENIESLLLLKEAFGSKGIKSIILDYVIPRLEEKINEILSQLSDFSVQIDTQKESLSSDKTIEGLYINIKDQLGNVYDYNSYSGGERCKITSSIAEGLASLCRCDFRVLDESITALDSESTSQFIETLDNIQKSVSQLIVISHISEVKDVFEDKIEVVKEKGISIIK